MVMAWRPPLSSVLYTSLPVGHLFVKMSRPLDQKPVYWLWDASPPHERPKRMTTLLEQEIYSQPDLIAGLLKAELAHIGHIASQVPPHDFALIAARGSSDHTAQYAKYVWGSLAGLPVALAAPSLHTLYSTPPRLTGALVIGIS